MVWGKSAGPVFRESGCRRKWPHFCAAVRPGKCAPPLDAAPLAPPCRRVKDAWYRPAHGCGVRGVVPLRGPPVEFTRSGAWGPCFWGKQGVFLPNRVRNIENMTLFFGPGLLYTRGWGLRPGGVLVGSLTCCRSYSCGGGSVPCLAVCRWALLVGVSLLGKKACVFVQIEESVVTVFDCTWACKEAEQQAQWQQGGAW